MNNPTQTNELMSLAARVEEATGADTLVDAAIWQARGNSLPTGFQAQYEGARVPRYTASLDAAMTLADDEQITELLQEAIERLGQAGWMPGTYKQRLAQFFTAAALKARAHSERTGCD